MLLGACTSGQSKLKPAASPSSLSACQPVNIQVLPAGSAPFMETVELAPGAAGSPRAQASARSLRSPSPGARPEVRFLVALSARSGPCHLDGKLAMVVLDSGGRALPVQGNPDSQPVTADLRTPAKAAWTWANACSPDGRYRFEFFGLGAGAQGAGTVPVCRKDAPQGTLTPRIAG